MSKVISHVVAAERQHCHWVEAKFANLAASGQRGPHERLCSTLNSTLWTHFALQEAFGWASRELQAPLLPNLRMPVGSNTKAMVAAAMYQLQQSGLLNVSASASDFLDPKDFPDLKGGCLSIYVQAAHQHGMLS